MDQNLLGLEMHLECVLAKGTQGGDSKENKNDCVVG